MTSAARGADTLPLSTAATLSGNGWTIRLKVRAEAISLSRRTVVRERVLVRREQVEGRARVKAEFLREELRTSKSGRVDISNEDTEEITTNKARTN